MDVILYSTGCPRCTVLKKKLDSKDIKFNTVTDIGEMVDLGIQSAPMLSVDGELMNFTDAIKWVNSI